MKPNPKRYIPKYDETTTASRFKTCRFCGKNLYPSERDALSAATTGEVLSFDSQELKVYKCPFTSGWHISSR
ncbi:hypothetical protein FWH09_00705 [Candidatus Saccharibacteria bacterium]|nr:hypothetical protein [Candidatus Saccharibacteria bacterium]